MTITNGYLTTSEAVEFVGRNDARDTELIDDIVTSVSRLIDRHCGRHFYQQAATARIFDSWNGYTVEFGPFNDLVSVSSFKYDDNDDGVYEVTLAASRYQLLPVGANTAAPVAKPYTSVQLLGSSGDLPTPYDFTSGRQGLIEITGTWGWPSVPPEVKQSARLLVNEVVKLQDAPLGIAGGDMGVAYVGRKMPGRVLDLLSPFRLQSNAGIA